MPDNNPRRVHVDGAAFDLSLAGPPSGHSWAPGPKEGRTREPTEVHMNLVAQNRDDPSEQYRLQVSNRWLSHVPKAELEEAIRRARKKQN